MTLIWTLALVTLVLIIVSIWTGTQLGARYKKRSEQLKETPDHSPVGSVVGASLGLLAFMLAFTFQLTANRLDGRRELLRDEVIAIRTTWLRAGLLSDSNAAACRQLLDEYVELHVQINKNVNDREIGQFLAGAKRVQDSLWQQAVSLNHQDRSSETYALFTDALNEMINIYNKRVVIVLYGGIPPAIYWILYFIIVCSMLILGFQFGISGKGSRLVRFALAITLTAVMWLIFALDNPRLNLVKVNHQQLFDLQKEIRKNS